MGLEFRNVVVHAGDKLLVIVVGYRLILHIAPRKLLGQNFIEHRVLIVHDGLVDAAVGKGAGRHIRPLVPFDERIHALLPAQREELGFQIVVIRKAVVPAGRVENPVSDVNHIQKTAELFF